MPNISHSLFAERARPSAEALERARDLAACEAAFATLQRHLPRIDAGGLCYLLAAVPVLLPDEPETEAVAVVIEGQVRLVQDVAGVLPFAASYDDEKGGAAW